MLSQRRQEGLGTLDYHLTLALTAAKRFGHALRPSFLITRMAQVRWTCAGSSTKVRTICFCSQIAPPPGSNNGWRQRMSRHQRLVWLAAYQRATRHNEGLNMIEKTCHFGSGVGSRTKLELLDDGCVQVRVQVREAAPHYHRFVLKPGQRVEDVPMPDEVRVCLNRVCVRSGGRQIKSLVNAAIETHATPERCAVFAQRRADGQAKVDAFGREE